MSFRVSMEMSLVLKIKEFQGRSLMHSWTEAKKDLLSTKYLARWKLSFVSVVLGTPVCVGEKGGSCQTLRASTLRFCYGWEMKILFVITVQLPGVKSAYKACFKDILFRTSYEGTSHPRLSCRMLCLFLLCGVLIQGSRAAMRLPGSQPPLSFDQLHL